MVGQRRLFDVGDLPGLPAAQRAAAINRRLDSFVRHPGQINDVKLNLRGSERVLTVAGREILTVTAQDAADNLTTVPELAENWQRELEEALLAVRAEHETFWTQISSSILLSAQNLLRQAAALIPRFAAGLLVMLITLFAARGTRAAVRRIVERASSDTNTQQLVRTVIHYSVWTFGALVALGTLGINPATLVAGLGVTTIALGFALKDLLSNFVSGFLILSTRPFHIGDQIAVKEYEGTVERIDLRATYLRTLDNRLIIIPNADVYTATIVNNTASPYRRQEFVVGVPYEADLTRARELAQQVARDTPGVLPDPAPDVLVDALANGNIELRVRFCTESLRQKALLTGSEVKQRLAEAFAADGIDIYPPGIQTVELRRTDRAEATRKAAAQAGDGAQDGAR
jgi:small conductance mechanosensitive channel